MAINRNKVLDAARKYQSRGQYDKAIAQYKKLVDADKRDVRSLLKIGDLYVRKGDRGTAIETYENVAGHYAQQGFFLKAIAVYKQILKLDPSRLEAQVRLGEMYEQLQLISDAMTVFEDVSNGFMRAGDTDRALAMLGKMVELDPEHIPVRIKYAEALSRAGRTQEAADEFEQGALLLRDQGRLDDYVKVAERLLYHRGNDVRVAKELAETYIARRDPKRALAKLQICFKADPRDVSTLSLLAEAFLMLSQTDKAISVYREVARLHREAQRPQERMSALRRILELNPNDEEAQAALQKTASASGQHYMPPGTVRQPAGSTGSVSTAQLGSSQLSGTSPVNSPSLSSASGLSGASGIMYVDEDIEEAGTVSGSLPAISEATVEIEESYPSVPPAPRPPTGARVIPIRALGPMTYPEFLALPLVSTQVAPATAALAPSLMERTLELADSYLVDGLFTQARAIVSELQLTLPDHPLVLEKAREVEELAMASSGVSAVAQPLIQPEPSSIPAAMASDPPEMELEYQELAPGDEGFDFAEKLAEELAEVAEIAPIDEGAEMIDVETVFEQFKAGVAEQVSDDDSDTHFDLGIAYKEMGLFPDARREFQVAMGDPRRRCLCWTMIGLIYLEEGQPRDAIEAFQSGLESPEKTPREAVGLHYELAMACEISGLTDQARLHYEFVFQREPQYREVGQRLQRLGGPSGDNADELLMESMDDVNRAFDELIHED
ncbi:MAG: tetratricopeptide repeat protein [Deltaproteobacteria bacterium]|nr:tetratricopeptide repeat protein [Deltaproteobacteria bacterium]MBW2210940.1 tetratricopeptide repeat protein [Deltaproteobacteria bacterium]MBW2685213.1 tetratricopeptide repeat protein [Deltaproteobacteria bacterium]